MPEHWRSDSGRLKTLCSEIPSLGDCAILRLHWLQAIVRNQRGYLGTFFTVWILGKYISCSASPLCDAALPFHTALCHLGTNTLNTHSGYMMLSVNISPTRSSNGSVAGDRARNVKQSGATKNFMFGNPQLRRLRHFAAPLVASNSSDQRGYLGTIFTVWNLGRYISRSTLPSCDAALPFHTPSCHRGTNTLNTYSGYMKLSVNISPTRSNNGLVAGDSQSNVKQSEVIRSIAGVTRTH